MNAKRHAFAEALAALHLEVPEAVWTDLIERWVTYRDAAQAEDARLRRVIAGNLEDARSALNLTDKGVARDYIDSVRYNAERALAIGEQETS